MTETTACVAGQTFSIVSGPPLEDEPGLGALTLPGFLTEVTAAYPQREAVAFPDADGVTRWTYAELRERSLEVAGALRACGVGKGCRVGVLMTNRPEWISAVFGISIAGGVAVTLSTFSTGPELEYLLQSSAVSVLLFERTVLQKDFATVLTGLEPGIGATPGDLQSVKFPYLRRLALIGEPVPGIDTWEQFLARGRDQPGELLEATAAQVQPSDAAVLFFSSGSTSKPKGILSAHRGVCVQLWRFRRMCGFGPEDHVRCWSANGFFWSGNFVMSLGATFAAGGSLVLQPTFKADEALELMASERVNYPFAWPHQWAQIETSPNWPRVDLSAMRFADAKTPIARHPTVSTTWCAAEHAYGNTETFTITTGFEANTPAEIHADSWGAPLPGVTVKVVDPLTGRIVPRGERGEIRVKGPTLMLGYIGTPLDETLDAEGFLCTGDGGYLDDAGPAVLEGRLTDIIKTGGANVSPREVDAALAEHQGVKVAQTVGVPHDTLGEVVVSCVVLHDGVVLEAEEIRAFLAQRLASYKLPRHALYVRDDDIAQTGNAKIKSGELRQLAAQRLQGRL